MPECPIGYIAPERRENETVLQHMNDYTQPVLQHMDDYTEPVEIRYDGNPTLMVTSNINSSNEETYQSNGGVDTPGKWQMVAAVHVPVIIGALVLSYTAVLMVHNYYSRQDQGMI